MFKVLIWDHMGISAQWLERFLDMKFIDVVGTIKSPPRQRFYSGLTRGIGC